MSPRMHSLLYLSILALLSQVLGKNVNVTIDDQQGDPTTGQFIIYSPPEAWQTGQNCTSCTAKPSPASDAWMGTWTDASFNPNGTVTNSVAGQIIQASVPFIGTAVYVQVILTGSETSPDGNTDYTFSIDNENVGVFQQSPNGDSTYKFNQTVFSKTGLTNSLHTLTIESGHAGKKALVLLDSIIYTKDDGTGSTSTGSPASTSTSTSDNSGTATTSSSNVGVIVGPIVGAILVVGVVIALAIFLRRRQRDRRGVRVSLDSPPMGSAYPTNFGSNPNAGPSSVQLASASNAYEPDSDTRGVPYITNGPPSHTGSGYSASPIAATAPSSRRGPRSDLSYGSSALYGPSTVGTPSQILGAQSQHNMHVSNLSEAADYPAVGPSTSAEPEPFSPPAYSEVDSSGGSNVSRLPNPNRKQ